MTTFNLTCEAVEATLHEYLDETLEPWVRASIEEHLGECARCTAFARELRNISSEAAALPALLPEREVWPRIAGRIGAPVIDSEPIAESAPVAPTTEPVGLASDASPPIREPREVASEPPELTFEPSVVTSEPPPVYRMLSPPTIAPAFVLPGRREKRRGPKWMSLAAAALVLVSAGTTFLLTRQWLRPARTPNVASEPGTRRLSSGEKQPAGPGSRGPAAGSEQVASGSSSAAPLPGQLSSALTVSATSAPPVTPSPEQVVYAREINTLQRIVRRKKPELDTSTVAEIDKNLRILDSAIGQIRAALRKDPGSSLLDGQASRALEMKVELLRRAAMLRSNS
jgi:hypothetical protein